MIKVKRLSDDAKLPKRAYDSIGYDLYSIEDVELLKHDVKKVRTGIAIEIPEGYVGIIKERSSVGSKGVAIRAGVIDPDYRGEVIVVLHNIDNVYHKIKKGDKVAQLLIVPVLIDDVIEVEELTPTERGANGFGSSDKKN